MVENAWGRWLTTESKSLVLKGLFYLSGNISFGLSSKNHAFLEQHEHRCYKLWSLCCGTEN